MVVVVLVVVGLKRSCTTVHILCNVQNNTHTHRCLTAFFPIWVGRYQKDKPFWIFLKQEMMGWQWHQLNHMQIFCTSLQTDNHTSTSSLHIFTGRMPFLPPNQLRQSTISCMLLVNAICWCNVLGLVGAVSTSSRDIDRILPRM